MKEAFMNTEELVALLTDPVLLKSFNTLLNDHGNYQSIEGHFTLDNVVEDSKQKTQCIVYFVIWTPDTVVFTSRLFMTTKKTCFISMVHTHNTYKRQGICSGSFKKIFKHLKEISRWQLNVEEANIAAIACYRKIGFKAAVMQTVPKWILMNNYSRNYARFYDQEKVTMLEPILNAL